MVSNSFETAGVFIAKKTLQVTDLSINNLDSIRRDRTCQLRREILLETKILEYILNLRSGLRRGVNFYFVQSIAFYIFAVKIISAIHDSSLQKTMKRQTTIHDIAKHLNITASTVSRALNNNPRISAKTKERVKEAAEKLNYEPNIVAANLRSGRGTTIGVIVPVINRYFFANIIHGIEQIMEPAGYNLIICPSHENLEKEKKNIQTLINNRVSGILISISKESRDGKHFEPILTNRIPLVQFDRVIDEVPGGKIRNDDFKGAYNSVAHLIKSGYKKIAHFSGPIYIKAYQQRIDGYKKALSDHNIDFREELIFENVISRETGIETMEKILLENAGIDAVFAASDMSALGALLALKANGINVPEQMGISGYVNEPFGELIEPSLTSTEQFGEEMGKTAAKEILRRISNPKNADNQSIAIDPKLIIRESSFR